MDQRTRDIVSVVVALGDGEVTTYGEVADVAGHPKQSRLVGRILSQGGTGQIPDLPWWRVVNATGRLVPGHEFEQSELLRAEGVDVRGGRVVAAPIGRFSRRSPDRPPPDRSPAGRPPAGRPPAPTDRSGA